MIGRIVLFRSNDGGSMSETLEGVILDKVTTCMQTSVTPIQHVIIDAYMVADTSGIAHLVFPRHIVSFPNRQERVDSYKR
jgi:hypothetical protein